MRVSSSLLALLLRARESMGAGINIKSDEAISRFSRSSFYAGGGCNFEDSKTWIREGTEKSPLPYGDTREDYDLSHLLCQHVKSETVPREIPEEGAGNVNNFGYKNDFFMVSLGPSAAWGASDCGFRGCPTRGADCGENYTGLFDVALGISVAFDIPSYKLYDGVNPEESMIQNWIQILVSDGQSSRSLNIEMSTHVQVEEYAEAIPFQHCEDPETCDERFYPECRKGWAGANCTEALTYHINITECTCASPEDWYDKWDCDVEPDQVRLTRDNLPTTYKYVAWHNYSGNPYHRSYHLQNEQVETTYLLHTASFQMNLTGFDPIFLPSWISGVDIWEESGAAKAVPPLLGSAAAAGLFIWLAIPL